MNDRQYSFFVVPLSKTSNWRFLIEAGTAEELQAALARRHFNEEAVLTVYASDGAWIDVSYLQGYDLISHSLTRNLISRRFAADLIRDAGLSIDRHIKSLRLAQRLYAKYSNKPSPDTFGIVSNIYS